MYYVLGENMVSEQTDEVEEGSSGHPRCSVFRANSSAAGDVISAPRHERTALTSHVCPSARAEDSCSSSDVFSLLPLKIYLM